MTTPVYKRVTSDDVTGDWSIDAQLLTGPNGRATSDMAELLTGKAKIGANLQAEFKTLTISTPPSDWNVMSLLNSFTSTTAVSNGFAAPRWRYSAAGIQLSGGFEKAAPPAVPLAIAALPAGLVDVNEDSIVWLETSTPFGGAGLIRLDAAGSLTLRAAGGGGNLVFCGLDNIIFAAPKTQTPALSCFPVSWKTSLPGGRPTQVEVMKAVDVATLVSVPTSNPAWSTDGNGNITIANIQGLALGRTYQITCRAMP